MKNIEIEDMSTEFEVRILEKSDVDIVYDLSIKNSIYYQYHPPMVTRGSILEDMDALPPGKTLNDKYYIGFFKRDKLIAVMDLIMDYPKKNTAFIGLFMMDVNYQNKGIGSKVIGEVSSYLKSENYEKIRLGVDKGNPQSYSFWNKNGFVTVGENQYIIMERIIM